MKKIVIDFDNNEVTTFGKINETHINLAIARLRLGQTKPSKRDQFKKAIRCAWKAFVMTVSGEPTPPQYIEVRFPLSLECKERAGK